MFQHLNKIILMAIVLAFTGCGTTRPSFNGNWTAARCADSTCAGALDYNFTVQISETVDSISVGLKSIAPSDDSATASTYNVDKFSDVELVGSRGWSEGSMGFSMDINVSMLLRTVGDNARLRMTTIMSGMPEYASPSGGKDATQVAWFTLKR